MPNLLRLSVMSVTADAGRFDSAHSGAVSRSTYCTVGSHSPPSKLDTQWVGGWTV